MVYLILLIIELCWIFNPYPFIKFLSRIYGWNIQKGSRSAKWNIIGSRISGIILLLFTIFVLLEDYGILKRSLSEILAEATKNVNLEILAYMLSIIMGIIIALTGFIALVAPSKFRSYIWSKSEKSGLLPIKQHVFQNIFFYWFAGLGLFIDKTRLLTTEHIIRGGICLIFGSLKRL